MNPDQIIEKMEALTSDIEALKGEMNAAEEGAKSAIKSLIDGKTKKFDELAGKLEDAEREEKLEKAKASRKQLDEAKAQVPEVKVPDSEHNKGNFERDHGKAILAYVTDGEGGDHAKSALAREKGDEFVREVSTEDGIRLTASMTDYIVPQATAVSEIEETMGKSVEEVFGGKATVLVREASGSGSGGGSSVNVDFEPTLFKTPKRDNGIPQKCWVKRAVGKEAQYPKLDQTTNPYGVQASWGDGSGGAGEGTTLPTSDPVQSQQTFNLERLSLLTSMSKRYVRNNDVNFLAELAWMMRGTVDRELGKAVMQGVSGYSNAPTGINSGTSISNGVGIVPREVANQVSYTDLVNMQFKVDDGIFGAGEYFLSAGENGSMKYVAALTDSNGRPIFGGDSQSGWGVGMGNVPSISGQRYTNAIENTTQLGGRGDVIYGNLMGFALPVDASDMAIERSDDFGFDQGKIYFRIITYAGGGPLGYDMFSLLGDLAGVSSSSSSSSS